MAEPGRFSVHKAKPSVVKRGGSVLGVIVCALVGVAGLVAFGVSETTLVDHVRKRDDLGPYAAYLLGVRGIKTEATRTALVDALGAVSGNAPADPKLRAACAFALGSSPTHDAVAELADASGRDPEPSVRAAACHALGKSGDTTMGVPALLAALDDQNKQVRLAACEGAKTLKDVRLADHLIDLLQDHDYDVRLYATRALKAIAGEDLGVDVQAWNRWRERHR